jgi:Lactonase, 7-bladed beta-propeller
VSTERPMAMEIRCSRAVICTYRRMRSGTPSSTTFRAPDGSLTEAERVLTGGNGSGTYKPVSGQESAPNAFEGANSVILTPDTRFLFATNGGDNSVSSFAVGEGGKLTLLDAKRTGNVVSGRSGGAKALRSQL